MSLKCSIFGHAFDDATVEREREEQGSEVVITIREVQTCARCGETRVVSENKEVTTLETPDDIGAPPAEEDEPAIVDAEPDADVESEPDADGPPTEEPVDKTPTEEPVDETPTEEPVNETPTEEPINETPAAETEAEAESASDEAGAPEEPPVTDDAEILDDDGDEEAERKPGQWPQEADEEDDPDADEQFDYTEDSGIDESKTDAEFIDDAEPEEPTTQPQTNEWPSEDEIDAASESESAGPGAVTVPNGSFVCEECGFSTPAEQSSLREGDFCPECYRGTLVQVREDI